MITYHSINPRAERLDVPYPALGVEVTVKHLAEQCSLGNIDPQHGFGSYRYYPPQPHEEVTPLPPQPNLAAIELALTWDSLDYGFDLSFVTVRPDLDSVGAMALLTGLDAVRYIIADEYQAVQNNTAQWFNPCWQKERDIAGRIKMVADADKFARGEWKPRPLPSRDDPWPATSAGASELGDLAAIAAAVADHKVPMAERVETMRRWLEFGQEPRVYREQVERERQEMIDALEQGDILIQHLEGGSLKYSSRERFVRTGYWPGAAVVVTTHRAATMLGYSFAPVVIAINPAFISDGDAPRRKVTICQYREGYINMGALADALNEIEPGWGGSKTIIGSPQDRGCELSLQAIVDAVESARCEKAHV